jgi:hypothetical protein
MLIDVESQKFSENPLRMQTVVILLATSIKMEKFQKQTRADYD